MRVFLNVTAFYLACYVYHSVRVFLSSVAGGYLCFVLLLTNNSIGQNRVILPRGNLEHQSSLEHPRNLSQS